MEKVYKIFFKFYTFFGILCLRFNGVRFEVSKINSLRMIFLCLSFATIHIIYMINESLDTSGLGMPEVTQTKFSTIFLKAGWFVPASLIVSSVVQQIIISKDLAQIFNIFLSRKLVFKIESINYKKVSSKALKSFLFFAIFQVLGILWQLTVKQPFSNITNILFFIFGTLINFCFIGIFTFLNALLIHYEFVIETYNKMLERQVLRRKCCGQYLDILMNEVNDIFDIIKIFNRSASKVLTLAFIFIFFVVIFIVSFKLIFSENI